jgi:hypothetical protein
LAGPPSALGARSSPRPLIWRPADTQPFTLGWYYREGLAPGCPEQLVGSALH